MAQMTQLPPTSEGQGDLDQLDRLDLRLDPRAVHRAKLDNNEALAKFATMEKVCRRPSKPASRPRTWHSWSAPISLPIAAASSTEVAENLTKAMAAWRSLGEPIS
jgi:hypothetical protein